jgi:hypothetical protein
MPVAVERDRDRRVTQVGAEGLGVQSGGDQAETPPPPPPSSPPPSPPAESPVWYSTPVIGWSEAEGGEAEASSETPIYIPPGVDCVVVGTNPFRSATNTDLFVAEAWLRLRCNMEPHLDYWDGVQELLRYNAQNSHWVMRAAKPESGTGPAITNQGPYSITTPCRSLDNLIVEPTKLWKHQETVSMFWDNPPGISTANLVREYKGGLHCG